MTKPTRKRYTFTPSNRSSQFRDFKQVWLLAAYQRCLVFFTRMENFIFGATSRRSPQKIGEIYFSSVFSASKQIVFFAAFIMKFRQCLTPHNLCIPSPLSIHMVIRYLWCLPRVSQSRLRLVRVGSSFHCIALTD